ncbi:MAG: hypothetical protein JWM32_2566 [Verrucomicrobia bacterium]|nr:hypothetical protein [Verrucomicrobiota bacterium]
MRPLELSVANDVAVLSLNSSCALIGGAETEWAQLAAFGQLADRLTVPWVRVFDGSSAGETDLSLAWTALDRWRKLRRRFKWKTALLVETHGILANAEAIMRFLGGAPDVGLLWDSHYTWLCGEDPVTTWQAIGARVERIHVKDSLRCHDAPGGCEYVLPGTGEFPMNRLGPILEREFSGAVTLEWEKLWHPEIPSLEAALASARARGWW